ncbi:hypothetical protein GCM10020331_054660 [Ectobacillus funiculus]
MTNQFVIVFFMSSLLLGFRHGIDWDHIAAITDLVGVETKAKKGNVLSYNVFFGSRFGYSCSWCNSNWTW